MYHICEEIELNKLDFYAYKPSPIDSVFTRFRTWFLCIKTESIRLGLYVQKPSLMDSFCIDWNQVHWTRFIFSFATRHSNVALKTLYSKKLSHSLPHSQSSKKKLFTELKKFSHSLLHSQSTHSKNSVSLSLSLHSISVSAPVSHSLIWLHRHSVSLTHSLSVAPLPSPSLSPSPLHLAPS